MNRKKSRAWVFLLFLGVILSACGPSQDELDAQATQAAADAFATQTAEAPTPTPTPTVTPSPTPTLTPTPVPTDTPTPTPTNTPTATTTPTATPTDTPTATPSPQPATESPPTAPPAASTPAAPAPPSSDVVANFLTDARQTQEGLFAVKVWFDRLAGGETIPCSTVFAHGIHVPSSMAPGQVADLVPIWNEYQTAIADGQQCLQSLVDFCAGGGGTFSAGDFWTRRDLSSSALSRAEHVVQALEAGQ